MKKIVLVLIIGIFLVSTVYAAEWGDTEISVGYPPSDSGIGLIGSTSMAGSNGDICTSDVQCLVGKSCLADFDSGNFCGVSGTHCVHDGTVYTQGNSACTSANDGYRTCNSGSWTDKIDCGSGYTCSAGDCVDSTTTTVATDSDAPGGDTGGDTGTDTPKASDGESCSSDSGCESGNCVHGTCRSSGTYCGDGYCDSGENCIADDNACAGNQICSNGCETHVLGDNVKNAVYDSKSLNAEQISEIIDAGGLLALEKSLGEGIGENKDNIAQETAKIINNVVFERFLEVSDRLSLITLKLTYNGAKKISNLVIYDKIPKTFSPISDNITVISDGVVHVVKSDPEYGILYEDIYPDDEINITYSVRKGVDLTVLDEMQSPEIFVNSTRDILCGDGYCDKNEDCAIDCIEGAGPAADIGLMIIFGALVLFGVLAFVIYKLLPSTIKDMIPSVRKDNKFNRFAVSDSTKKKLNIAEKIKKNREKRKFTYKY